jgi:four helix bundle protein
MEKQRIGSFKDLETWQLAMDLVDLVLSHLKEMPEKEWDLKRQMSKAVISIPANVAEGWKRKRRRGAYQNHVSIAMGSQGELETEVEICFRNNFLDRKKCFELEKISTRVGQLLERLHDSLD